MADSLVRQVENLETVDVGRAYTAKDFERVDSLVEKVAKELGPRRLFLVRGVPDSRAAKPVVRPSLRAGSANESTGRRGEP